LTRPMRSVASRGYRASPLPTTETAPPYERWIESRARLARRRAEHVASMAQTRRSAVVALSATKPWSSRGLAAVGSAVGAADEAAAVSERFVHGLHKCAW